MNGHEPHLTDDMLVALRECHFAGFLTGWEKSRTTIAALKRCGFIERDPSFTVNTYYRITPAGLAALNADTKGKGTP